MRIGNRRYVPSFYLQFELNFHFLDVQFLYHLNQTDFKSVFSMLLGSGSETECCCDFFFVVVFFVFNDARSASFFLFGFLTVKINFVSTKSGFKRILCPPNGFNKQLASKCRLQT